MTKKNKKNKELLKKFSPIKILQNVSTSKILLGIFMIFMNIGSRYIELKL